MPVQLRCACGRLLRVRDELVGKRVKCPGCGGALLVLAAPPEGPDGAAIREAPPRALRRAAGHEPPGDSDWGRPRPRPRQPQAAGNLALWLAVGGAGLA